MLEHLLGLHVWMIRFIFSVICNVYITRFLHKVHRQKLCRISVKNVSLHSGLDGVYPHPALDRGVPRQGQDEGYPNQVWMGVPQGIIPPQLGSTPRYRTTDGVLDMPQSVCLLRSRRRTFLLSFNK